jgi:hypothetical protein
MITIGDKRGNDTRCMDCVDYSDLGAPIHEGEDFTCTYCGDAWKANKTEQAPEEIAPVIRKAVHTNIPGPILVDWPMNRVRRAVAFWDIHLKSVIHHGVVSALTQEERSEYGRYVSDEIGDTDGYCAPVAATAWKAVAYPERRTLVKDAAQYGRMLRSGLITSVYGEGL